MWEFQRTKEWVPLAGGEELYRTCSEPAPEGATNDDGAPAKRVLAYAVRARLPSRLRFVEPCESFGKFVSIDAAGYMTLKKGYAWDGASGPTLDTVNCRRGALAHDACYTLLRQRKLGPSAPRERKSADVWLNRLLREDGMRRFRAFYWYLGVRWFGATSAGM